MKSLMDEEDQLEENENDHERAINENKDWHKNEEKDIQ